jgi:hypothetical protein
MPATPAPAAPQPTPANGGAGGGLSPRSAPPGWTPPASMAGDIWTKGRFGQALANGSIAVSVSRLAPDASAPSCTDHNPLPAGMSWIGFSVKVTWSGFPIPVYGADVADQGLVTCWIGDPAPLTSGVTYQVFKQVPIGSTPAWLRVGLFPNGASPAYIFEFS